GFGDFFELFVLQAAQMLVDDRHRILKNLRRPISILSLFPLKLMETQLIQKALPQSPAPHARRAQLWSTLEGSLEVGGAAIWLIGQGRNGLGRGCSGSPHIARRERGWGCTAGKFRR